MIFAPGPHWGREGFWPRVEWASVDRRAPTFGPLFLQERVLKFSWHKEFKTPAGNCWTTKRKQILRGHFSITCHMAVYLRQI